MSWNTKTRDYLTRQGYISQVVEYYNSYTQRKNDLFGFIDTIAIGQDTIGIQTTSRSNISTRYKKCTEEVADKVKAWLNAGNKLWIIGHNTDKNRKTFPEDKKGKIRQILYNNKIDHFSFKDTEINNETC